MRVVVPIIIVNGELQQNISALDRGLAHGDGVFETMVAVDEDIPLWQLHYDRLRRGLLSLAIPLEMPALVNHMRAVLANVKTICSEKVLIKLMITRGDGKFGYSPPKQATPTFIAIVSTLSPDKNAEKGVKVHYCEQQLPLQLLAGVKTLNQLIYVLASQERSDSDFREGLLFNDQQQLIEATARNVFLVNKDNQLLTPTLDHYGIEGVMRRLIIDTIAPRLNIDVIQTVITKLDIVNAREFFLTNSVTCIWPVVDCEGQQWHQGSVTMAIKNYLVHFLQNEKYLCYSQHPVMHTVPNSCKQRL